MLCYPQCLEVLEKDTAGFEPIWGLFNMTRQHAFIGSVCLAAGAAFLCPIFDSFSTDLELIQEAVAWICALSTLTFLILAIYWFRQGTDSQLAKSAILVAVIPFGLLGCLWMFNVKLNYHGGFAAFYLYGFFSEVCALILLLAVGIRRLFCDN
jgi:hypothetical protein